MKLLSCMLMTMVFSTGCATQSVEQLDPQYQKNFETGINLIANNMVCHKCETGNWPTSLHEMMSATTPCDTSYLDMSTPNGESVEIPNMKLKVEDKDNQYWLIIADENANIDNLSLEDNFTFIKVNKSDAQCQHRKAAN